MPVTKCPHCIGEVAEEAKICKHCTRLIKDFQNCRHCLEPVATDALYCPYCTQKLTKPKTNQDQDLKFEATATRMGCFFAGGSITGLMKPSVIQVFGDRIVVTRWELLGLRKHSYEIQHNRLASVRYTSGVLWGGLLLETFGGASEDLTEKGLRQADARFIAEELKDVIKDS